MSLLSFPSFASVYPEIIFPLLFLCSFSPFVSPSFIYPFLFLCSTSTANSCIELIYLTTSYHYIGYYIGMSIVYPSQTYNAQRNVDTRKQLSHICHQLQGNALRAYHKGQPVRLFREITANCSENRVQEITFRR